jgi:hypothetical protein
MQKISSYLYPNKINVVADETIFSVRWNIVYQNRVKIYQGVDNVLTLDVKNADQKRIDISSMNLEMAVMDINGREVVTASVIPSTTQGLATINIPAASLVNINPQFLNFSIYRINEDESKNVLYADTQFGAKGTMELLSSVVPIPTPTRIISRWNPLTNDQLNPFRTTYYSDAVEVKQPNHLTEEENESIIFDIQLNNLEGVVKIQFTKDTVISAGVTWIDLLEFNVTPSTPSELRQQFFYPAYNREWSWARIIYDRTPNNTGSIDKVIVRL